MYTFLAFVAIIIMCLICLAYDSILGVPSTDILVILVLTLVLSKLLKKIRHKAPKKSSKKHPPIYAAPPASISPEEHERAQKLLNNCCVASAGHDIDQVQESLAISRNKAATRVFVYDTLYIIEGHRQCFHCKKYTPVIAFGLECFIEPGQKVDFYYHDTITIAKDIWPLPPKLQQYLSKHYEYYTQLGKNEGNTNHCVHCGRKQGNYYLFEENYDSSDGEGIFFDPEMSGDALTYYPIKLPNEVSLYCEFNHWVGTGAFLPEEKQIVRNRFSWE